MEAATSIDKAVDVLFHLHQAAEPQGVSAIGRALALPKSSTHRLLSSLARRALVEQDAEGRYRPGIGLVALGLGVLDQDPAVAAAKPVLEAESAELGETCFLVAAHGGAITVLDKAEGRGFLRAAPRVGQAVPVHATAVGKLYLAFAPELLAGNSATGEAFTSETLCDPAELDHAVSEARDRRWAANRDEWIQGLSVVAAPVFRGERMVAAVAVACASARVDELGLDALSRRLCEAGESIGRRLTGTV